MREFLTPEQRAAIGDVVAESVWMEEVVRFAISAFAGVSDESLELFLSGRMIDAKLQILEGLCETDTVGPDKRQALRDLVTPLRELNTHRVTVVHGMWEPKSGGYRLGDLVSGQAFAEVVRFRKRGKERILSTAEVVELAERIAAATRALLDFVVQELIQRNDEAEAENQSHA